MRDFAFALGPHKAMMRKSAEDIRSGQNNTEIGQYGTRRVLIFYLKHVLSFARAIHVAVQSESCQVYDMRVL